MNIGLGTVGERREESVVLLLDSELCDGLYRADRGLDVTLVQLPEQPSGRLEDVGAKVGEERFAGGGEADLAIAVDQPIGIELCQHLRGGVGAERPRTREWR